MRWDDFGYWLYVPKETRSGIGSQQYSDSEKLLQVIQYILTVHPLASWRVIILALQWMEEHPLAESIQEYAEPVTGMLASFPGPTEEEERAWYTLRRGPQKNVGHRILSYTSPYHADRIRRPWIHYLT